MNLVEIIFQNLMALLPFVIIKTYERGVRFKLGKDPHELQPGFHWRFPIYHSIDIIAVVDDFIETPIQSVLTKDEKLVVFSVNIGYRIDDAVKHDCGVQDFLESTKALAMVHLAERVRAQNLQDTIADLKKLESSLTGTLTTRYKTWGTSVFQVGFVNFAEVPQQIRIFSDISGQDIKDVLHTMHTTK